MPNKTIKALAIINIIYHIFFIIVVLIIIEGINIISIIFHLIKFITGIVTANPGFIVVYGSSLFDYILDFTGTAVSYLLIKLFLTYYIQEHYSEISLKRFFFHPFFKDKNNKITIYPYEKSD